MLNDEELLADGRKLVEMEAFDLLVDAQWRTRFCLQQRLSAFAFSPAEFGRHGRRRAGMQMAPELL